MEMFGKAAWIVLLAGLALLPLGGCTRTPSEPFQTYDHLKNSSGDLASGTVRPDQADAEASNNAKSNAAKPIAAKPDAAKTDAAKTDAASRLTSIPSSASIAMTPTQPAKSSPAPAARATHDRKVQVLIPFRNFKPEGQEGALRVSYDDIDLLKVLNMDPVTADAATKMPAWLKNLEGQRIRIRGFMYPTFQQTGVHAFGLARDNQICCFGRNPKIYDVFDVLLRDGVTTNYIPNRPFDVVGVFHIRPEAEDGKLYRLYEMDDATVIVK
jgi:hypothetical protein